MDAEMIKATAWPLALVVLLILIVIFKEQLRNILQEITEFTKIKFKRGLTEVEVSKDQETKQEESKPRTHLTEKARAESPAEETTDEVLKLESETPDELRAKMFVAFSSRNIKEGEEIFKKIQESETDAVEKLRNEIRHLLFRYNYASDTSAMSKLKDLAEQKEVSSFAQYVIGHCYEKAGDFEKAAKAYEISAQDIQKEERRASIIVSVARCLFKSGEHKEAFGKVMNELGKLTSHNAVAKLYEGLASLYELKQDPELQAIALEKAIENRPNDTDLHFTAAYSYSEREFDALTLLHYKTLLRFTPDNDAALNNIAHAYALLEMPMRAVKFFKKSTEFDNTLAMSNLAERFTHAGFAEEALQILDKAKQQTDMHAKVGSAISEISEKEETESKTEELMLNSASEQQKFLLSFAEAYFPEKPDLPNFKGVWQSADGIEMTITQSEDQIEANCVSDNVKYKFEGSTSNRAARIITYKVSNLPLPPALSDMFVNQQQSTVDNLSNSEPLFIEDLRGYAYLSLNGQQLFIMKLKEHENFMTLSRTAQS